MTITYKISRRTFKAKFYPEGSEERISLNKDALTSEYMPSYRYHVAVQIPAYGAWEQRVINRDRRTKREAIDYAETTAKKYKEEIERCTASACDVIEG